MLEQLNRLIVYDRCVDNIRAIVTVLLCYLWKSVESNCYSPQLTSTHFLVFLTIFVELDVLIS